MFIQTAVALLALGAAWGGPWSVATGVAAAVAASLAVGRRRGRSAPDWLFTALAFRSRIRQASRPSPDGTPRFEGPLAVCTTQVQPYVYTGRDGRVVGMIGDGTSLTAVIRAEAGGDGPRSALDARPLPVEVLAGTLLGGGVDGIVLESAQLLQQTRPAPAGHLSARSAARLSYTALQERAGPWPTAAARLTWVALKFDPELCREAVAARGGGLGGAQRCLVRVADQVASRLVGAGFRAAVLDQADVDSAVSTAACTAPVPSSRGARPDGPPVRRQAVESARAWRCDGLWHTTYAMRPRRGTARTATAFPRLVSLLASVPAHAVTFSLTVRPGPRGESVTLQGHVRVTGGSGEGLIEGRRKLESTARAEKAALVRLDREQLPGLLATLPLGGMR